MSSTERISFTYNQSIDLVTKELENTKIGQDAGTNITGERNIILGKDTAFNCIDINDYFPSSIRNIWFSKLLKDYTQKLRKLDIHFNNKLDSNLKALVKNWIFNLYRYDPFFYYFAFSS